MEDILAPAFYLDLVNGAYNTKIRVSDLTAKKGRIVARVRQHFKENNIAGGHLNHYKPSAHFLNEQVKMLPQVNAATLDKASNLFDRINGLLT